MADERPLWPAQAVSAGIGSAMLAQAGRLGEQMRAPLVKPVVPFKVEPRLVEIEMPDLDTHFDDLEELVEAKAAAEAEWKAEVVKFARLTAEGVSAVLADQRAAERRNWRMSLAILAVSLLSVVVTVVGAFVG